MASHRPTERTVGVDLAADPRRTGLCVLAWDGVGDGQVRVEHLVTTATDEDVLGASADADVVGIDAPLGWPEPFVAAVVGHRDFAPWPQGDADGPTFRRSLAYRATDEWVHAHVGRRPLSVSADRLGVVAFRCAHLVDRLHDRWGTPPDEARDRSRGRVVEVWPRAGLEVWGLAPAGYRTDAAIRRRVVDDLLAALGPHLPALDDHLRARLAQVDAFDALLCALLARAAGRGRTQPPPTVVADRARVEGWIHVPTASPAALVA